MARQSRQKASEEDLNSMRKEHEKNMHDRLEAMAGQFKSARDKKRDTELALDLYIDHRYMFATLPRTEEYGEKSKEIRVRLGVGESMKFIRFTMGVRYQVVRNELEEFPGLKEMHKRARAEMRAEAKQKMVPDIE